MEKDKELRFALRASEGGFGGIFRKMDGVEKTIPIAIPIPIAMRGLAPGLPMPESAVARPFADVLRKATALVGELD